MNPIYGQNGELLKHVTVQTDITSLVKSRLELKKLSLVASKTNNSVIIADREWRIEWVNDGFTKLMGYTLQEAAGKIPSQLLDSPKADRAFHESLDEKLARGMPVSFEVLSVKRNGEEVWLNIDVTAIFDEAGEVSQFIEVQTDITALKVSELEQARLARDLYEQNLDLQQFTYIVSHNLRAPVANALGLISLMAEVDRNCELYDAALSRLRQTAEQLDTVMKDMNAILSIRESRGNLEQEAVDIHSVIQQALAFFQEQLQDCGGSVIQDVTEGTRVRSNSVYLYSVFSNLLSNAIKYRSGERPLEVRIKCAGESEEGLYVSFSDNGTGFDLDKANGKIFRLYKRFHKDRNGRGVGLYLVKSHLEAMGGRIEVFSKVGEGTRFLIYLPYS